MELFDDKQANSPLYFLLHHFLCQLQNYVQSSNIILIHSDYHMIKLLLIVPLLSCTNSILHDVLPDSRVIGKITTYLWTISFDNFWFGSDNLTLYFPTDASITSNAKVTIDYQEHSFTIQKNTIIIHDVQYNWMTYIRVSGIRNPYYPKKYTSFAYLNNYDGYVQYSDIRGVKYNSNGYMYFFFSIFCLGWFLFISYNYSSTKATYFLPYAIIFFTSIIQVLLTAIHLFCQKTTMLYIDQEYSSNIIPSMVMIGLAFALGIIRNLLYLFTFIKQVLPFLDQSKQNNYKLNYLTAIIAAVINFQIGYLPYAKMSPHFFIPVRAEAQLANMNRLSKFSLVINGFIIIGCSVGIVKSFILTNNFLLYIDLMVVVVFNSIVTIVFLIMEKPIGYYCPQQISQSQIHFSNFDSTAMINISISNEEKLSPSKIQLNKTKVIPIQQKESNIQEIKLSTQTKQTEENYRWRVLSIDF